MVDAKGTASETGAVAMLTARRTRDRAVVATVKASVPLTERGGKPALSTTGRLDVDIDVAKRSFADLAELLPARLRGTLPPGELEVHVDSRRHRGAADRHDRCRAHRAKLKQEQQRLELHADLSSSARGLAVATTGNVWLRDEASPIATIAGTITTGAPLVNGKLDAKALRASAQVDATIRCPSASSRASRSSRPSSRRSMPSSAVRSR